MMLTRIASLLFILLTTITHADDVPALTPLQRLEYRCFDLMRQEKYDAVITLCSEALDTHPSAGVLYFWRGRALHESGKPDKAIPNYNQALLHQYLYDGETYYYKAIALESLKRFKEASGAILEAVRRTCHHRDLYNRRRVIDIKEDLQNIESLTESIISFHLGEMCMAGMYAEGLLYVEDILKAHPHSPNAHYNKAMLLREYGHYDRALLSFAAALKYGYLYKGSLYYEQALCLEKANRLEEALIFIEKALDQGFTHRDVLYTQDGILMKLGRLGTDAD